RGEETAALGGPVSAAVRCVNDRSTGAHGPPGQPGEGYPQQILRGSAGLRGPVGAPVTRMQDHTARAHGPADQRAYEIHAFQSAHNPTGLGRPVKAAVARMQDRSTIAHHPTI